MKEDYSLYLLALDMNLFFISSSDFVFFSSAFSSSSLLPLSQAVNFGFFFSTWNGFLFLSRFPFFFSSFSFGFYFTSFFFSSGFYVTNLFLLLFRNYLFLSWQFFCLFFFLFFGFLWNLNSNLLSLLHLLSQNKLFILLFLASGFSRYRKLKLSIGLIHF